MFPIRLADLAQKLDAELHGDGNITILGISSMLSAKIGHITFLSNKCYRNKIFFCKASAVILTLSDLKFCKSAALVVKNPYLTYIKIAKLLDNTPKPSNTISNNAVIDMNVNFGKNVSIGANTVIESGVNISDHVIIGPGCFIGKNVEINTATRIWANVSIYHEVHIGKNCLIHAGSVIGSDGFGYVNCQDHWMKIPQIGSVTIGNQVEIGSCTTIDRGSLENTEIGNGVIIDNQCHVAHNVIIGNNTAVAGGVIMGGSLKIGSSCMIGGATVINGHIEICNNVTITGMSMVIRSIKKPGIYSSGLPVQSNKHWRKSAVLMMHIEKINQRLKKLSIKLNKHII